MEWWTIIQIAVTNSNFKNLLILLMEALLTEYDEVVLFSTKLPRDKTFSFL